MKPTPLDPLDASNIHPRRSELVLDSKRWESHILDDGEAKIIFIYSFMYSIAVKCITDILRNRVLVTFKHL